MPGDKDHHPEWGAGTGSTTGTLTLGSLVVGPYSTEDFSPASTLDQLPLPLPFCSIRIQYSGAPGSVEAEVSSVEENTNMVVDARVENEGNGWAGSGANPWRLDAQTESVLFLTNESARSARIGFSVTAGGVHYYLTMLKLNPHETRAINIRALRDAQIPDFSGSKIPATAGDGSVNWVRLDNLPVMGRLMVIERRKGIAANYDCCICQCPAQYDWHSFQLNPGAFSILPTGKQQCNCYAYYIDCNGYEIWTQLDAQFVTWASDNPSVASMDGTTPGQVDGVAGGRTQITASAADCWAWQVDPTTGNCDCTDEETGSGSSTATVQVPTTLSIVSGTSSTTAESPCDASPGNGCGVTRSFTYQVLDQYGSPITAPGIADLQIWDSFQTTSPNGLEMSGYTSTCSPPNTGPCGVYVNSQGRFGEGSLGVCSTVCYANNTCVTAGYTGANQTWNIGPYSVVQQISFYCDHVAVNGQ